MENMYRIRTTHGGFIAPARLKQAKADGKLTDLLHPFDEIDIPTDADEIITMVCAYVEPTWARFVLKDSWDEGLMNEEPTNKGGYYKSEGRRHVLEDILPHLPQEWRDIIVPRHLIEEIDGQLVEYDDPMWLLSTTDVFGKSAGNYWVDLDGSFQLPIFERERDRAKECGDKGTYPYWLRSVSEYYTMYFCDVHTSGDVSSDYADVPAGFAPGFDI